MRWVVLVGLLVFGLVREVDAQYRGGRMWVVCSGLMLPVGPDAFSDRWKSGFGIGGGVHYCLDAGQRVSLRATAGYLRLSPQVNDVLLELGVVDPFARFQMHDGSGSIGQLMLEVKVSPRQTEGRWVPYAVGGPGLMRVSQDVRFSRAGGPVEQANGTETNWGWRLGAGVDVVLSGDLTVFVEGQYAMVFASEAGPRFVPVRVGVLF